MSPLDFFILGVAGLLAGLINAVVGSGSLITFPALLALGYPSVLANVTNNVGVLPASVAAAWTNRHEYGGAWRPLAATMLCSAVGGLAGALLLLRLPKEAFEAVVPALIALALVLVIIGPRLKERIAERQAAGTIRHSPRATWTVAGLTGVYGGYFGAAQGVLLLSLLSLTLEGDLHRANAYKNALAATANIAAAIVFVSTTHVSWPAAIAIAVGSLFGGILGGRYGRLIPQPAYRALIVAVGGAALCYFVLT